MQQIPDLEKYLIKGVSSESIFGYKLLECSHLIGVLVVSDFKYCGVRFISKSYIEEVVQDEETAKHSTITEAMNKDVQFQIPLTTEVSTWHDLWASIDVFNRVVLIDKQGNDDEDTFIGGIVEVRREYLMGSFMNSLVEWPYKPEEIPINSIRYVEIDTSYLKGYEIYIDNHLPNKRRNGTPRGGAPSS